MLGLDLIQTHGGNLAKDVRGYVRQKLHDTMIRNSVFAAIVFLIVGHPATFRFVDNIVKVKNPDLLVLVHAIVFALIMYFGSIYIFMPIQKALLEGFKSQEGFKKGN